MHDYIYVRDQRHDSQNKTFFGYNCSEEGNSMNWKTIVLEFEGNNPNKHFIIFTKRKGSTIYSKLSSRFDKQVLN